MGVALRDLFIRKELSLEDLQDKILVIDTYNNLYQYLSSIRQRDGSLLVDSKGNITSHLIGLFSRTTNLMQKGLRLVFVFDGTPPLLKKKERDRRKSLKNVAEQKYAEAKKREDVDEMKKYASRTSRLTNQMIDEAKKLVTALGLPIVQAPSEGEAQAAYMVSKGDAFAVVSQDYDSLICGADRVVQDLTISAKRKKKDSLAYQVVNPTIIGLSENLNNLGIDQEQLIVLAILVGTDYNIGGVKGIGPKNALKLIKEYNSDFDSLFKSIGWEQYCDVPWTDIFYTIKKMPVTDDYILKWSEIDEEKLFDLLVNQHDFSEERVLSSIKKLGKDKEGRQQKGLGEFF